MNKSDRIKSLGGPGGLRCTCCGGCNPRRPAQLRAVRSTVRAARKANKTRAIREGRHELEDNRAEKA